MTYISALLSIAVAIVIDTAWVAVFRARPVGKFKVTRRGEAVFQFLTTVGQFTIYSKEERFDFKDGKTQASLPFAHIKGLEYRVNASYALIEELFFGYNLTDFLAKYQDTIEWFSVAVVTHQNKRIPLYVSGQYTQREFLLSWYIELQSWLLTKLGLLTNVEGQSHETMELLRSKLGNPPLL